jgi:hypothetical protein
MRSGLHQHQIDASRLRQAVQIGRMVFAGVDAAQADAAVREGTGEFQVPSPPSSPRAPFGLRGSTR